jgi:hypothetical protein
MFDEKTMKAIADEASMIDDLVYKLSGEFEKKHGHGTGMALLSNAGGFIVSSSLALVDGKEERLAIFITLMINIVRNINVCLAEKESSAVIEKIMKEVKK